MFEFYVVGNVVDSAGNRFINFERKLKVCHFFGRLGKLISPFCSLLRTHLGSSLLLVGFITVQAKLITPVSKKLTVVTFGIFANFV